MADANGAGGCGIDGSENNNEPRVNIINSTYTC